VNSDEATVAVMKQRWALSLKRPKDAEDARGVIAVQGERLESRRKPAERESNA
jgi:hypothetical protein